MNHTAAIAAATGTVIDNTYGFQLERNAFAGRPRKAMDETCVAKMDSATAHVGSRPPPVMNPFASPISLRNTKLHPKRVVPARYTAIIAISIHDISTLTHLLSDSRHTFKNVFFR